MEKPARGNHRQKVRLVCNQDMFVPIKHLLNNWNAMFILQLTVIKNAGADSICSVWIYCSAIFINHFTFCHPRSPGFDSDPGVLLFQKLKDSFPATWRKPSRAWTNSCNGGKWRV